MERVLEMHSRGLMLCWVRDQMHCGWNGSQAILESPLDVITVFGFLTVGSWALELIIFLHETHGDLFMSVYEASISYCNVLREA